VPSVADINATSLDYVQKMTRLWLDLGSEERKAYLRWQVLHAMAGALPPRFIEEDPLLRHRAERRERNAASLETLHAACERRPG
jgi:hypothetical protein